ncbi:Integrator complex subunit 9, partial [Fasciola gigantica]
DIFGLLVIRGFSAGFGIGSCNWTLSSETDKVAYISHTSLLYSHVLPFDDSQFANCDILVVGTMNMLASTRLEKMVGEFRTIIVQTLARGGHVLVPTNPCGLLFDLLETAIHAKENFNGTLTHLFPMDRVEQTAQGEDGSIGFSGQGSGSTGTNMSSNTGTAAVPASDSLTNTEAVSSALVGGGSSLAGRVARCPVYTIAGQIRASLAYANAYGEWLNSEKESLLYTADAPFPYQTLIRSGQLITVRSLHETPLVKDLTTCGRSVSPGVSRSSPPLLDSQLNGQTRPVDSFGSSGALSTVTASVTSGSEGGLALFSSGTRNSHAGLSGGSWPAAPCLIFASHPSLRFGPAVHLLRAMAYGGLKPGGRTAQNTQTAPRHSVVLVESSDYVMRYASDTNSFDKAAHYMRQILAPYFPVTNTDSDFPILPSPTGLPSCNLTDSPDGWNENTNYAVHVMSTGEPLSVCLHAADRPRTHPVRLSANLVNHMRPVCLHSQNSSGDHASGSKRRKSSGTCVEPSAVHTKRSADEIPEASTASSSSGDHQFERTYISLIDGVLVSRDGKYWLNDSNETTVSGAVGRPVIRTVPRPSTPPLSSLPPGSVRSRPTKTEPDRANPAAACAAGRDTSRIYVSQTARINPHRLIKELTERGVTGAYLADSQTASHMTQRFAMFDLDRSTDIIPADGDDFILFPNPNTAIRLSDHGSHILTVDDSTRTAIRDTILSCLQPLDTCIKGPS